MKKTLALLAALFAFACVAQAQSKVAAVDMQRAAQAYWKTGSEEQKLNDQQRRHQEFLRLTQEDLNSLVEQLNEIGENAENPAFSTEKQNEFRTQSESLQEEIMRKRQQAQNEQARLQARAQEAQRGLENDIRAAVQVVAKRRGLDIVYPTQVVIFASQDITDEVISELNKSAPAAPAAAPAAAE